MTKDAFSIVILGREKGNINTVWPKIKTLGQCVKPSKISIKKAGQVISNIVSKSPPVFFEK